MLDSGYYDNQVWGELHKARKGYTIAKNKDEYNKMELYARRVQELQHDLGLEISHFLILEYLILTFYGNSHRRIMITTIVTRIIKNKK